MKDNDKDFTPMTKFLFVIGIIACGLIIASVIVFAFEYIKSLFVLV